MSRRIVDLNKVFLVGRLTRDPELRYVPNGTPVTNFGIAVNRRFRVKSGEWKEETCFVNIATWSRLAELCGEYLRKSSMVFIEGRLQSRSWEVQGGERRTAIEVRADKVQFLDEIEKGKDKEVVDGTVEESAEESVEETEEKVEKPNTEEKK